MALLSFSLEGIIPLLFFISMGALVLVKRPYAKPYNNVRVVANMVVCVAVESVYIWYRSANNEARHSSPSAFYLPLFVCILLLLAVLYNSVALIYQLVQTIRELATKNKLEEEEKMEFSKLHKDSFMEMMKVKKSVVSNRASLIDEMQ